jgi:hypothetical protein
MSYNYRLLYEYPTVLSNRFSTSWNIDPGDKTKFLKITDGSGADPGFQVRGGGHTYKGGAKILGVFRVKNHDFTPKNHISTNFRGGAPGAPPPPGSAPGSRFQLVLKRLDNTVGYSYSSL